MKNDNKIAKQVNKIKVDVENWLIAVKTYGNQNASTDRTLEAIIKDAKELETLYNKNVPEGGYDITVYPDEYEFDEATGLIKIPYDVYPYLSSAYNVGDEVVVKFEEEVKGYGTYTIKELNDDGMILEFLQ